MIGSFRLVGNVGHDIGSIRHLRQIVGDLEAQHAIGARRRHRGRRVDIDLAIFLEIRIDGDALHASLALAEEIVGRVAVTLAVFHSEQRVDLAVRQPHRKAFALFGKEHCAVFEEGHVPRALELIEDGRVRQNWNIRGTCDCCRAAGRKQRQRHQQHLASLHRRSPIAARNCAGRFSSAARRDGLTQGIAISEP
jgi:hypothetical protein